MTEWLPIVASGVSGAVVTLLGVITGGAMTSRGQRRQWNRDKQINTCTAVIQESTRVQLALRQQWKYGRDVDWTARLASREHEERCSTPWRPCKPVPNAREADEPHIRLARRV